MTKVVFLFCLLTLAACGTDKNSYIGNPNVIEPNGLNKSEFQAAIPWEEPDFERLNAACYYATNEARLANNRQGLRWNGTLETAAHRYAAASAIGRFLAHEHPNDRALKTPDMRVAAVGGVNPYTAENLAMVPGFPVEPDEPLYITDQGFSRTANGPTLAPHTYASIARRVVQGWLDSPGHRQNLLDGAGREVACGVSRNYDDNTMPMVIFVQKFQFHELLKSE